MRRILPPLLLAAALAAACIAPALAQENLKTLNDPAFDDPLRVPVAFDHNAHNEKAKLGDCSACHHVFKNGKRVPGEASMDRKCSDCHRLRPAPQDAAPALMNAFHARCQGCHKQMKKGPLSCGQCHKR